ncbi:MAG: glycosyltransferase family 4 protein [Desulfobacterales bacterium]|nr:glycosyltransferase family 4 protein [Desulfobacterales bacterium]
MNLKVWVIQDGEPIPGLDKDTRAWRSAMLCNALLDAGHEVLWWASTFDHAKKMHRFSSSCTVEMTSGIKIRLLHGPGYKQNKSLKRFYHNQELAKIFAQEILYIDKPDIIFASIPTIELSEQAVKYGKRLHVPVLLDIRDAWPDHYLTLSPPSFRWILKLILFYEFKRALRTYKNASGLIAISETYIKWALGYAQRNSNKFDAVFPMAYSDILLFLQRDEVFKRQYEFYIKYGIQKEDIVVSFIGSFTTSFDFYTIIEAIDILNNKYPNIAKILMVGDGPEYNNIRELSQKKSNIIFTGWLDQISIRAILKLSSVGIAPYKSDTYISLPNKPFEYMAAGLPLLSSLRGELDDLIKKEQIGLKYRAGDSNSLVKQILWLAEHPEERISMGKRSRQLFEERYNADLIYPKLVEHLEFVASTYKKMK